MNIERQYLNLLQDILDNGIKKEDRTGTGTISVFGRQIRHKMSEGFPLLTTKKMFTKGIFTELLWILRGQTNIQPLVQQGNNIWVGDAYKNYVSKQTDMFIPIWTQEEFIEQIKTNDEFAEKWGELGPVYGKQWRRWSKFHPTMHENGYTLPAGQTNIDQIQNLINDLKTNPDSRRLIVSAWNPSDLQEMTLPPCHNFFQFYTRELSFEERLELIQPYGMDALNPEAREKWMEENNIPTRAISLMFNMRSVDVPLGLPFNIASYATLLQLIAEEVNMIPEELVANLGDTHIYQNQIDGAREQLEREPRPLPKLIINDEFWNPDEVQGKKSLLELLDGSPDTITYEDFLIGEYDPHPPIKYPLSN